MFQCLNASTVNSTPSHATLRTRLSRAHVESFNISLSPVCLVDVMEKKKKRTHVCTGRESSVMCEFSVPNSVLPVQSLEDVTR